jgi:predicted nucleic acid-binding protein
MTELVLVDTSVWINHLREGDKNLAILLQNELVACHPFIIGELACGNMKNRNEIINLLNALPSTPLLEHDEIMDFIEGRNIINQGIGYVDVHILGSAIISETPLWTLDKSLKKIAKQMAIEYCIPVQGNS